MLNIVEFTAHTALRRKSFFARLREGLSFLFVAPSFEGIDDTKLADHYWAAESALLRAVRSADTKRIGQLHQLHSRIAREMRRRQIL